MINPSVNIQSRAYMSITLIQSAALFCREAKLLESEDFNTEIYVRYQSNVIGAILMSVSFIEAYINETYCDISDNNSKFSPSISNDKLSLIENMWNRGIPRTARYSILEKYEILLELLNVEKFNKGTAPYQEVKLLISLRNSLVHYEPEWIISPVSNNYTENDIHSFEKKLRGKFTDNPMTGPGNAFYPDKCLGLGCAVWGLNSSIMFVDEFCGKSGIKPSFDHVRNNLIVDA